MKIINLGPGQKQVIMEKLNALLIEQGRIKLLPAAAWLELDPLELRVWCHCQAVYALPTLELVNWIKNNVGYAGEAILEIGSGCNDLGYHVGIRRTDSYMQVKDAAIYHYYQAMGQTPTSPKKDVEQLEALEAVKRYHPLVVVGAWITQYGTPDVPDSSLYGVKECDLIQRATYIFIGHDQIHHQKQVFRFPCDKERHPWLLSRMTHNQAGNFITIWHKPEALPERAF